MFTLTAERLSNVAIILHLAGRLDSDTTSEAEARISDIMVEGTLRYLIADLREVHYVSSAGLRLFITSAKALQERSGDFILAEPQETVAEVLDLTGMIDALTCVDSLDAALALVQ